MKKTKFSRFFETLIYTILLALPLISVFARVIYTQTNKNAYLSYSDSSSYRSITINDDTKSLFLTGKNYIFNGFNMEFITGNTYGTHENYLMWTDISFDFQEYFSLGFVPSGFSVGTNWDKTILRLSFYDDFTSTWSSFITLSGLSFTDFLNINFEFTLQSYNSTSSNAYDVIYNCAYISYLQNTFGKLDNAFNYGLQKTIDDFGHGNINFTSWFGTLFSNNTNLLYVNFVNMYLNYALWVSVSYLLYYFLNWFIRFVRETLDNLIYKETKN